MITLKPKFEIGEKAYLPYTPNDIVIKLVEIRYIAYDGRKIIYNGDYLESELNTGSEVLLKVSDKIYKHDK